jgi:hypothetical protein
MATVLQIPGALEIAGNIPDIIIDSETPVSFKILLGAETILDETYDPDANDRITIRLRDILPSQLSVSIPDTHVYEQTGAAKTFTFDIDDTTSNHVVVAGGVNATIDATTFLAGNWLTWQLQQKRVKYLDPEYLGYYATEAVTVKLKAYYATGDPETIDLTTLTAGKFYTLNVNFQYLSGLFATQPVYFDIWTETAAAVRLSFIQRFVLQNDYYDSEDIFVFQNSLGGIDTIRFTGEKEEDNKFDISSALFDEDTKDYDIDYTQVFRKKTGYFSENRERVWANEFFNSTLRYLVTDDGLKLVTISSPEAKIDLSDNTSINYEFKYALSRQTKYLNLARADTLPEEVEIIDPETEVFFLAPRLNEFPVASLNDLLIFPVQMPFTEEWRQLAYSTVVADILQRIGNIVSVSVNWGKILGDMDDQDDLKDALALKADLEEGKVPLEQIPYVPADFEPAITKSTGYLKWNGSAWQFVNETYSLSSHNHTGVYATVDHLHTETYIPLVDPATNGKFPVLTAIGNLVNSVYGPSSFAPAGHDHSDDYISIINSPIAGNIPTVTSGGELLNSAYKPADFEPAITKSTGYLKWNGSAWQFVNETYSLSSHNHTGTYEPVLSNPSANGYILSSTTGGVRSWVSKNTVYTAYQTLTDGATITWNMANGYNATVTLGGNRTLSITNVANGMSGCLIVKQDATGSRTLTLPAGSIIIDGGILTLSSVANRVDVLTFTYDGTNYLWSYGNNYLGPS